MSLKENKIVKEARRERVEETMSATDNEFEGR